ncbi:MAG TPA: CocE/NonD family hydrolase [Candidatus Corynebacterium avicola]|uniref:CocE/NonD family hydrolase n=1 Tax=Candidatus Corynebacterium avicola TaxID=2838527 RepID=A0A9D1RS84_9CORY|nr:CocE/NonD family hydrolase [Candidatus Corynebacterium avicola]
MPRLRPPFIDRLFARRSRLPRPTPWEKEEVRIPLRDGVHLAADLYTPTVPSKGVVLVRTPYGRGMAMGMGFARVWAGQGYTVVYVASRGTNGSSGTFDPMRTETADGHDVVAWLREQSWYPGTFATFGHSYLGYTQWSILADPPEDLVASVVMEGPHDFSRHAWGTGSFHYDIFGWSQQVRLLHNRRPGDLLAALRDRSARKAAVSAVPVLPAATAAFDASAPWLRERLEHPDLDDPFVAPMQHADALKASTVPTLIIAGWQDIFLVQSMEQYRTLRDRGVTVRLVSGAWGHLDMDSAVIRPAVLNWLDAHLAGVARAYEGVDVEFTPAGEWRHLDQWPPAGAGELVLHPATGGVLADEAPDAATASFLFDPADPTPSSGGNEMSGGGYREDSYLVERPDVLTFDTAVLDRDVTLAGAPRLTLRHTAELPDVDLFVRVSDVDGKGRSTNVTETFRRVVGEHDSVELDLLDTAHVFTAGHRIRLSVAGGWFPFYSRNPGNGENPLTADVLHPNRHTVTFGEGTALTLPTVD